MSWMDELITSAFGQTASENAPYFPTDQKQMVRDFNNVNNQNMESGKSGDGEQDYHTEGQNQQTGESFALDIKPDMMKAKTKKEQQWIDRELTVTFTSLDNQDKYINSSLSTLCGGKYANLKSLPLPEIADILVANYDQIFNYVDSSIANYSERITPDQAFRIAKSVSSKNNLSYFDYEKIYAKLNNEHHDRFHDLLKSSSIKISYPMNVLDKELHDLRDNRLMMAEAELKRTSEINYYIDYIKSFKEYKLGYMDDLKKRVSSVLSVLESDIRDGVIAELNKDSLI